MPWLDDCDEHSVCMGVDPDTSIGRCVATCNGFGDCPDDAWCVRANDEDVEVCLPLCNPFAAACDDGHACVELTGAPACVHTAELPLLVELPCDVDLTCEGATVCTSDELVPGCLGDSCCAPYCDLLAPMCTGGLACVPQPWDGDPPPVIANLGLCAPP